MSGWEYRAAWGRRLGMPRIVVLGGGVCGLAAGLLLARDGHAVTLLERDPAPVPDSPEAAWEAWERRGVAQFHQTHFLQSRGRRVLEDELPDVLDAFAAAGATRFNALDRMPPGIADRAPRPGDDRFATLTGRRTTLEHVLARTAEAQPGLTVRRGAAAFELITRPGRAAPHVVGVRTAAGEALAADLVVDAMGRASRMPQLAAAAGGKPGEEEAEGSGFIYYTRFFRGAAAPELRGPLLTPYGSFSILTAPADSGTWSITVYVASGDRPLKRLRHEAAWTALVRACPLQAHWLDGEPISGVLAMGGVLDRRRAATPTRHGRRRRGRRMGVHEPVDRPRHRARAEPRRAAARHGARHGSATPTRSRRPGARRRRASSSPGTARRSPRTGRGSPR